MDLPAMLVLKMDHEVRGTVPLANLSNLEGGNVTVWPGRGFDGQQDLVALVGGTLVDQDLLSGVAVNVPDLGQAKIINLFSDLQCKNKKNIFIHNTYKPTIYRMT